MSAADRMRAARTALVLDDPFFGALALRLDMFPDPTCKTAWTDGARIGYSPAYVESLTHAERVALLVHEIMHCANGHPWRRDGREPKQWNRAADLAINPVIRDAGYTLPGNVLLEESYAGKSAEWIHARLPADAPPDDGDDGEPDDGDADADGDDGNAPGGPDGDDGEPADGTGDADGDAPGGPGPDDGDDGNAPGGDDGEPAGEVRDAPADTDPDAPGEYDWREAVQTAARAAKARGELPGALARFAADAAHPPVDWRSTLRRFCQSAARQDYTFARPNRRYAAHGMILPSLHAEGMGRLVVAIDTSGSVDAVLLGQCARELSAIADDVRPASIVVVYCDTRIGRVDTFADGDPIELRPVGGGGTDFRPVFEWIDADADGDGEPAALVYLTDLAGTFPDVEPAYPVLWGVTDADARRAARVPFGETVTVGA